MIDRSLPSEDFSSWRQSVIDYIKDVRASRIVLKIEYPEAFNAKYTDITPILDALEGSDVTEVSLGRTTLTNRIRDLTKTIGKTKIETLSLESCIWTVDDFMSLMAVLKDTRISKLNIPVKCSYLEKSQQIKKFIAHVVNSRLKVLDRNWFHILPHDKLSVLVQRLPDTKITRLDLTGFCFQVPQQKQAWVYSLVSILHRTAITDLSIGHHGFGDDLAKAISPVLEKSKLEKLNLNSTMLTDSGMDILVPGLINSKITHLDLNSNQLNGDNSLGRCLKNTKLRELDISSNSITKRRIFSEHNFLQGSAVTTLKLNWCFQNGTVPLHLKKLKFSELTCLDLSGNNLNFEHISAVADVLINSNLTQINLSYNTLSPESFNIIGVCLNKCKLKCINLINTAEMRGQKIRRVSGIASFIQRTKGSSLISVNLSYNELHIGLDSIALALAHSTFLALDIEMNNLENNIASFVDQLKYTAIVELNLKRNDISDDGAVILANCLEETQVVKLSLGANSIHCRGAKALALVLKKTKVRQLNLEDNAIKDDGLESLAEHAKNACITYLNVDDNPGTKKLLIDRAICENRRKIKMFADLVNRTGLFTSDTDLFEFDRNFDGIDIDVFIDDCLKIYCFVAENPFIVHLIEQDKCTSDLRNLKRFDGDTSFYDDGDFFIEDCSRIYQSVLDQLVEHTPDLNERVSLFCRKMVWLVLEEFPRKLVSFIGKTIEADVEQHVSLLKKVEEMGLTRIEELLLLNRPMYVIDAQQDILHPRVYILLHKYKQPICNIEIEPKGMEKIIEYFTNHIALDGAAEVISLLRDGESR